MSKEFEYGSVPFSIVNPFMKRLSSESLKLSQQHQPDCAISRHRHSKANGSETIDEYPCFGEDLEGLLLESLRAYGIRSRLKDLGSFSLSGKLWSSPIAEVFAKTLRFLRKLQFRSGPDTYGVTVYAAQTGLQSLKVFLQAISQILDRFPTYFTIVVAKCDRRTVLANCRRLGIFQFVTLISTPSAAAMAEACRESDVCVILPIMDSGCSVDLSATALLQSGKPVVALKETLRADVLIDGVNGIVVSEESSDAWTEALGGLFPHPYKCEVMGQAGVRLHHQSA